MARKITFIGAGSLGFTRNLVTDILTFEAFQDAHICLMDINEKRLDYAMRGVQSIFEAENYPATVTKTTDLKTALEGSDGVLITILQGGVDTWRHDIEIPKRFGVDICVGDTRGPSGIFRFLRTAPAMLEICHNVEKYCPDAVVLNYTNPMAMLCRVLQSETKAKVTGLCHSVQGTSELLAGFIGAPIEEITYTCAGINHQAYFVEYKWNGKDAYPLIREAMKKPEVANAEPVRNELFKAFGYYCTESSGHNSEYLYWFRKSPDLIEKYCTHGTEWNPGEYAFILKEYLERENTWETNYREWLDSPNKDLSKGGEYASNIFNALFGNYTPYLFNGNLRNYGLVENLPEGVCVEVPVIASRAGIQPIHVDPLPEHIALLVNNLSRCEELAVKGFLEGDPMKIYHAICFDPLTASVLSLQEIREMTNAMFKKNVQFLTYFKSTRV